jgi:peptide/nickel transport system permease protein
MTEIFAKSTSVGAPKDPTVVKLAWNVLRLTASSVSWEVILSFLILLLLVAFALFPDLFATHDPFTQNLADRLQEPSRQHFFGTDKLGRDVYSRIVYGARISLLIAASSVLISGLIGVVIGLLAGYYGGVVETVLMRLTDIQLALPPVLLAIVIVSVAGPSVQNLILVLVTTAWVEYSRVIFNTVRSLREREFVIAAVAMGASNARILIRHILSNQWTPVIVISCVQAGRVMLTEAMLSFLGLGVQPPNPSWGNMLREGYDLIAVAPWLNLYPGLALVLAIYSINALGEAKRQQLTP